MGIQPLSDCHLEFAREIPPLVPGVRNVVLARDLAPAVAKACVAEAAEALVGRGHILYVPGKSTFYVDPSGFAATQAEARKTVLIQHVMVVARPPAHTRSSCRKRVKFNC